MATDSMTGKINPNDNANPVGKLADADAELHFTGGPLEGLKLIGFGIWERRGASARNVTFPARQYSVNGEKRTFTLLRPIADTAAQTIGTIGRIRGLWSTDAPLWDAPATTEAQDTAKRRVGRQPHRKNARMSDAHTVTAPHHEYIFSPRIFTQLQNAQAIVLPYDGINPLPAQYCYLKPHYLSVERSHFDHVDMGAL